MLNNITNFFNLLKRGKVKKTLAPNDMIAIGVRNPVTQSNFQPSAIFYKDLEAQLTNNVLTDRLVAGTREVVLTDNMGDAALTFDPGSATIETSGAGSNLILSTLTGDDIALLAGDSVILTGGTGLYDTGEQGGDIQITGGKGAGGNVNDAGAGGDISIRAGIGGNSISGVDGDGGVINIQGGYTTDTGTAGGDVSILAGGSIDGIFGVVKIRGAFKWSFHTTNATLEFPIVTLTTLLSASAVPGARAMITDSTVTALGNFGVIAAAGGANIVPVFSDGTDWLIG